MATGHRIGAGKGKVWDAEAVPPAEVTALKQQCLALSLAGTVPDGDDAVLSLTSTQSVMLEQLRAAKYHQLRKTLSTLSTAPVSAPLQPPIFAIERWQARCRLRETLHPEVVALEVRDPLLPSAQWTDPGLVQDFTRASYTEEHATSIAAALSSASHTAAASLVQRRTELANSVTTNFQCISSKDSSKKKKKATLSVRSTEGVLQGGGRGAAPATVRVAKHKHSIDFFVSLPKQAPSRKRRRGQASAAEEHEQEGEGGSGTRAAGKLYKLNHAHYQKLRDLFLQNRPSSDMTSTGSARRGGSESSVISQGEAGADWSVQNWEEFHERVYVLLSRYHSLLGHGFQAALNEHSFQVHTYISPLKVRTMCLCWSVCRSAGVEAALRGALRVLRVAAECHLQPLLLRLR